MFWKCLVVLMLVAVAVVPVTADTKYDMPLGVVDSSPELSMFILSEYVKETFGICGTSFEFMSMPNPFEISSGSDMGSPLQ